MPYAQQSSPLRKWTKRLVACVILGAVLQYLVAVGVGLSGRLKVPGKTWRADVRGEEQFAILSIQETRAIACDRYSIMLLGYYEPQWLGAIDWTRAEWFDLKTGEPAMPVRSGEWPASSRFTEFISSLDLTDVPMQPLGLQDEVYCGWPMRSASYFTNLPPRTTRYLIDDAIAVADTTLSAETVPRVIPLRIIWLTTLVNAATYGASLLLLWLLLVSVRAHWRQSHDRCPTCNYDLRATTTGTCPECGAATIIRER